MAKDQSLCVKDAVHKLQLALLDGIENEKQLFAAGSLISRSDYEDVVTERSIVNRCGYPLCSNSLPSERPRKGRYRISLKEHKVYDLNETYLFCSTGCVVNSRTFAGTLQEERCSVLNPSKLNEILRLFEGLISDGLGKNGDLGLSNLKIQENVETKAGDVTLEQWMGPSNAIEGYVPQRERVSKISCSKNQRKEGSSANSTKTSIKSKDFFLNEMDFTSTIMMKDEYTISKTDSGSKESVSSADSKESGEKGVLEEFEDQCAISGSSSSSMKKGSDKKSKESKGKIKVIPKGEPKVAEVPSTSNAYQNGSYMGTSEAVKELRAEKEAISSETMPKPSLKSSNAKKNNRSVTWADDSAAGGNLCEVKEMETTEGSSRFCDNSVIDDGNSDMLRFESAEACALALRQAAEAVTFGNSDATDAASEAGVIILPHPDENDVNNDESTEGTNLLEPEPEPEPEIAPLKWPKKPGIPDSDMFDPEDSWFDVPPEGFSLTLSTFATMWNALFEWITSSSLAYIYGREESSHDEYMAVNGREYPRKIVLKDGRSSEIKETLAGCVARDLPGIVAELRLPIPVSTLEQAIARLLDTMSFIEALPAFRKKHWQVIVLLFIDALSVCRIPALTPHMTNRTMLLHKVLDGAQISMEEYEVMKDLIIPLGRAPHFSAQSGG
ncbi:hypothetical protein SLE2022_198060 [Rubroshorea leprosula]